MASKLQGVRSGGAKHPEEMFLFLQSRLVKASGIFNKSAGGFLVEQESVPAMSVKVNDGGFAFLLKSGSGVVYPCRIYDGDASVVISSNSSGNTRIDAIVVYADLGVSADEDILNVYKLVRVPGTPAGSPVPPSDADIESFIGSSNNPYHRLANVTVASGATTITNANISDQRTEVLFKSYGVPVDNSDIANKAYVDANGFTQYTAPTTTIGAKINFLEGTTNGTNKTVLKGQDNQTGDTEVTIPSETGFLVPQSGWIPANETWAIYTENKADGDIDPSTDLVTVSVDIKTGTQLVWTSAAPTGLSINTIYYAIRVSATTIKFASSLANAQAGTAIDITADGSGIRTLNILNFIKIAGVDATVKYQKGDKLKLTNNSVVSYHYVLSVTKPSSDTIIEITGETWLVYSSAITLNYYSKIDNPQGFKKGDNYYKARAYSGAATSVSGFTKISLNTENFDINSNFSSDKYIAPVSGYYNVSGGVGFDSVVNTSVADLIGCIYKNGSIYIRGQRQAIAANCYSGFFDLNFGDLVYLNKGDYIELFAFVGASRTLNNETGSERTYLSISFNSI